MICFDFHSFLTCTFLDKVTFAYVEKTQSDFNQFGFCLTGSKYQRIVYFLTTRTLLYVFFFMMGRYGVFTVMSNTTVRIPSPGCQSWFMNFFFCLFFVFSIAIK